MADLEERYVATLKSREEYHVLYHHTPEDIQKMTAEFNDLVDKYRERLRLFLQDPDIHRDTLEKLARRKAHNTELLHKYGIL